MEGSGKDKDGTDNAPIRPVSSLLSHFENLSLRRSPSAFTATSPHDSTPFLRTPEPVDEVRSARASLDLPRAQSPWNATAKPQNAQRYDRTNGGFSRRSGSPGRSPGRRQSRPMSMNFHSSPQLAPTLTVDSPRSPPRGFGSQNHTERTINSRMSRSPPDPSRGSLPPPTNRPTTPSSSTFQHLPGHLSPAHSHSGSFIGESPPDRKQKSSSLPPPIDRAEKPKVPAKPAALASLEGATLALKPEKTTSEDRISPFSTPPGSPEKPSVKPSSCGRPQMPRSPSRPVTEPPSRQSFDDRGPVPSAHALRDARELGFSRRRPIPEPTRDMKPLM
ncbi:hypothetical protein KXX11_000957, partial [Aspergillus fumigatus]